MQDSMGRFSTACTDFGLTISIKKTEVLHQPETGAALTEPNVTVNGESLTVAGKLTYLGSTRTSSAIIDAEAIHIIARASTAFVRLKDRVWERHGLRTETKLKVYRAIVLRSLLHHHARHGQFTAGVASS